MYRLVYGLLYVVSSLPWWLLYAIGDGLYGLVFYVFGYRKKVVLGNLAIAFPEKTEAERLRIAKDFYHHFIDTIIETIKLLSVSQTDLDKRFTCNYDWVNQYYDSGRNIQLQCGHFFNWEIINLCVSKISRFPFVGVYQPLTNKIMNRIVYQMRGRNGTILIPANDFKTGFYSYIKDRYALGLAADQNPPNPLKAHWVPFFGRLTPFVVGPEKGAREKDCAVIFGHFYPVKRGYYHLQLDMLVEDANSLAPGELTKLFAAKVEAAVKQEPANYLWSHRRWKWTFDPEQHGHLVVQ